MEVSVIIPVYNAADYIDQSVRSALMQAEVKEVIVIDDGSDDGSYELLQEWELKQDKIKLLTHPGRRRKRAGASRNLGLQVAKSGYVAFLDADDFYVKNRFERTAEIFDRHSDAEVVLEPVQIINESDDSEIVEDVLFIENTKHSSSYFESILLDKYSNIPINGICFKRALLTRIGLMDKSLYQKQDKDFLLRLCLHANVILGNKNRVVAYYRHHKTNTTYHLKEEYIYQHKLFSKWRKKLNQSPISFSGKLKFIRQYAISKHKTREWSIIKKTFLYPFLIFFELVKNLDLIIPSSRKASSSPS